MSSSPYKKVKLPILVPSTYLPKIFPKKTWKINAYTWIIIIMALVLCPEYLRKVLIIPTTTTILPTMLYSWEDPQVCHVARFQIKATEDQPVQAIQDFQLAPDLLQEIKTKHDEDFTNCRKQNSNHHIIFYTCFFQSFSIHSVFFKNTIFAMQIH